jgi:hypothetical protein
MKGEVVMFGHRGEKCLNCGPQMAPMAPQMPTQVSPATMAPMNGAPMMPPMNGAPMMPPMNGAPMAPMAPMPTQVAPATMAPMTPVTPVGPAPTQVSPYGMGPVGPMGPMPTNVAPTVFQPASVNTVHNYQKTIVPVVHPSHTQVMNHKIVEYQHHYPKTCSVCNDVSCVHKMCPPRF